MPSLYDPHAGNVGWKGGQSRLKADKHGFIQRLGKEFGPVLVEIEFDGLIKFRKHADEGSGDLCRGRPLEHYDSGDPLPAIPNSLFDARLRTLVHRRLKTLRVRVDRLKTT